MKEADIHLKLSQLCQLMDVPIASYYYRPIDQPATPNYLERLTVIHNENFHSYGRRRMKVALDGQGIQLGVFKVARLMKEAGIVAKVPKKPHYYRSGKELPTIPNQLKRQFNPGQVNTHWVGDITYIRHHGAWSYLATVLDLGSREIVGFALSQTPDAPLARQALFNAIKMQPLGTPSSLMLHADQGVQYAANLFKRTLLFHRITQSMSRRGSVGTTRFKNVILDA